MTTFFATPYNIEPNEWSDRTALHCKDPSLAQQQFKDECDINVLMTRYLETGVLPQLEQPMEYGDFTGVFDFQTAMNAVRHAEGLFGQLPARIKNRFDNDPGKLINFLYDPANRDEAEFLGLLTRKDANDPGTAKLHQSGTETPAGPTGTQANTPTPTPVQSPGPKTP